MAKEKKENPKAFKHWINAGLLKRMSESWGSTVSPSKKKTFLALASRLTSLELKARVHLIREEIHRLFPSDYPRALDLLRQSWRRQKLKGFDLWPYTEFIQKYGLEAPELSLEALREITPLFTSEFAVRPFLRKYPEQSLRFLLKCTESPDEHVRRWASEGSRPRLPWGERLTAFVSDPRPTLAILEKLKYDESLYVRKSVANHLNDIAKDNPSVLLSLLKRWQKECPLPEKKKIDWITARALRTLIKDGNPKALELVGATVGELELKFLEFRLDKRRYKMDDRLYFSFEIHSESQNPQRLVVDYVIYFRKANRGLSTKVFKLKTFDLAPGERISLEKQHHLKEISTRRHYAGEHFIEIQINGRSFEKSAWTLKI